MSAVASSQWNHLNENYVKSVRISLRGSLHGALLKWGFCDLGIFDLDRSHLSRGCTDPLPRPLPSEVRSIICKRWLLRPVLFPSLLCECLCVVVVVAVLFVWFLPPNTFFFGACFFQVPSREIKATSWRGQPLEIQYCQIQGSRTMAMALAIPLHIQMSSYFILLYVPKILYVPGRGP